MSNIYLIRHGQATVNRFDYDNLSIRGIEQAEILGRAFRERVENVSQVRYGTLKRHRQSLEAFKSKYRLTAEEASHPDWNEYDHFEIIQRYNTFYQNRWVMLADMLRKMNPRRDFAQMFFKAMDKWLSGQHDDEYNESWPDYKVRTVAVFNNLVSRLGESENAVVMTSGGVISSIIIDALDLPDSYFMRFNKKLVNCSVTKFVRNKNGLQLSTINDHSVFERREDLITYI